MKTLMIMVALGMALGMGWWARGRAAIPTPRRVATVTAAPAPVRVAVARSPEENLAEIRQCMAALGTVVTHDIPLTRLEWRRQLRQTQEDRVRADSLQTRLALDGEETEINRLLTALERHETECDEVFLRLRSCERELVRLGGATTVGLGDLNRLSEHVNAVIRESRALLEVSLARQGRPNPLPE